MANEKKFQSNRNLELFSQKLHLMTHSKIETRLTKGEIIKHRKRTSIQHWQLRDLITTSSDRPNEIFYVNNKETYSYNIETKESVLIEKVDFPITSMTVNYGYLAAGGTHSNLFVKDLVNGRILLNNTIGGSINNAVHISKHQNETRLMVSNNDYTIKVFSLPSMRHITNIEAEVAVNYCSTSLDGKYLAAVGDDTFILIFDIRSSYRNIFKLQEFTDGGFSCSFNSACNLLAAASQDGSVLVWDLRKIKEPLCKLLAKQKTPKGACRCLKFSPTNGVDLLAFSEHVNYFHLVDTRNFTDIQQIRVARYGDHDISGITFTNDSSKLFVGLIDEIQQYHVDINARRMFCFGNLL